MELFGIDLFKLQDETIYRIAVDLGYVGDRFTLTEMKDWLRENGYIKENIDFDEWIQKFRSNYVS